MFHFVLDYIILKIFCNGYICPDSCSAIHCSFRKREEDTAAAYRRQMKISRRYVSES